jgi:hypothetical protein
MIEAREDVLGGMLAYLKRTILLQFIEEPVPVVVPMGDPVELRILANAWCTWYMEKNRADSCDGISGNAAGIVQRLREYADRIEEARSLRAELSHYQAKWLDHQHEIIDTIGQWLHTNVQQYQAYLESVREMQALRTYWQYIQAYYRHFHDDSNMPWCRNDRFTTSIYSLLDDINIWFPGRRDGAMDYSAGIDGPPTSGGNTTLPRITVQQLPDAVLDFSLIANAAGSLRIPVIKPVQVRLDTLTYAPPGFDSDNVPEPPPSLPPIPSILALLPGDVLNVEIEGAPPQLRAFFPPRPPEIDRSALDNMRDIVGRMDYAYVRFWKSLVRNPDDVVDGTEEDCVRWDDGPCMHVEMDLRERFQRMCARPAVILKEDLESIGEPRNPAVEGVADCPREDWACQYLNAQREYPSYGFGITAPENESQLRAIELIRGRITEQTHLGLPAEQRSPYAVPPNTITPSFGVPGDTDISPFDEDAEEEEPPPNQ